MGVKEEWVALYETTNGILTTRIGQTTEFYNKETQTVDSETLPTRYVGQVKMKIIAPKLNKENKE